MSASWFQEATFEGKKALISAKEKFTLKDIHDLKFDITFARTGAFAESVKPSNSVG